jgi:hypothetical protein
MSIKMESFTDYELLKNRIKGWVSQTIENFAQSIDNKDVYVFALDTNLFYGQIQIRFNTLSGLDKTINLECYQSYQQDRIYAFNGLKYSVGDFYYTIWEMERDLEIQLEDLANMLENAEEDLYFPNINKFQEILFEIVNEVKPKFELLDKSTDFIAFVCDHDEGLFDNIDRTVDKDAFYRAFPDLYAFDQYKAEVLKQPIEQQVNHWIEVFTDFILGRKSTEVEKLVEMHQHIYIVRDELIKLGANASGNLVTLFEGLLGDKPLYDGTKLEVDNSIDRFVCLWTLMEIKNVPNDVVSQLQDVLKKHFNPNIENKDWIRVAGTLHAIAPNQFPEVEHDTTTGKLLNYSQFI